MAFQREKIENIAICHANIGYDINTVVFENLDNQRLPEGVLWVRGGTGSGKTTFLRFLAGLLPPLGGSLQINGHDVFNLAFHQFLPYRLNIGYSFDFGGLLSNRTLEENLRLPLEYHDVGTRVERELKIEQLMGVFGLTRFRHQRPAHVPGGVRKATCVARAFVMDPEMVVLDDPTEGLGPLATQGLLTLLRRQLAEGQLRYAIIASANVNFMNELPGSTLLLAGQTMLILEDLQNSMGS